MGNVLLKIGMLAPKHLGIAVVLFGVAYWYLLYDDGTQQKTQIASLNSQIATQREEVAKSERAIKELETLKASLESLSQQFTAVSKQLPSNYNTPELLRFLSAIAKTTGVTVKSLEPKTARRERNNIVEAMPINIEMEGKFNEISFFVYYVSSLERITRVKNFNLTFPQGADIRRPRLNMKAEVLTYRFIGPGLPNPGGQ